MLDKIKGLASGLGLDLDKINVQDVITEDFIKNNTTLNSIKEFVEKSGFDISSIVDLKNIDASSLDSFIKGISNFDTWKEFLLTATKEQFSGKAGDVLGGIGDKIGGFLKK